jgi:hypothetical protein
MGHLVIRLPSYHYQHNLSEMTWTKVKREAAQLNNTFKLYDGKRLMNEATDEVTNEY